MPVTVILDSLAATRAAGLALGRALPDRALVLLEGPMGSGKTTLAKAICEALGVEPRSVISPTYTLVNVYPRGTAAGGGTVYHVDLYRLRDSDALLELDRDDWMHPNGVTLIEWPDVAAPLLAGVAALALRLGDAGPERRVLEAAAADPAYAPALAELGGLPGAAVAPESPA
jgi:tRNA threonylcarbamoyladenosine biosynthesis protein TsaE